MLALKEDDMRRHTPLARNLRLDDVRPWVERPRPSALRWHILAINRNAGVEADFAIRVGDRQGSRRDAFVELAHPGDAVLAYDRGADVARARGRGFAGGEQVPLAPQHLLVHVRMKAHIALVTEADARGEAHKSKRTRADRHAHKPMLS
jgi:hypothetical protein